MIELYQFPPAFGLPNPSPFCMKLETFLRFAGLEYAVRTVSSPGKAPGAKLPSLVVDGKTLTDSSAAIRYLEQQFRLDMDAGLSAEQGAVCEAIERLLEDHLYGIILYSRWMVPANWRVVRRTFFGDLGFPLSAYLPGIAQRQVRSMLQAQGLAERPRDEVYALGCRDIDALSTLMGEKSFLMGEEPVRVDCCAYGILANIMQPPVESKLKAYTLDQANLVAYCERMSARFFPPA